MMENLEKVIDTRWVIMSPFDVPVMYTTSGERSECIARFQDFHMSRTWKENYRDGYRCIKVEIFFRRK